MLAGVYWIAHPASVVPALWGRLTRTIELWRWRRCAEGMNQTNRFVTYRNRYQTEHPIDNAFCLSPLPLVYFCFCPHVLFIQDVIPKAVSEVTPRLQPISKRACVAFSSCTNQLDCHDRGSVECGVSGEYMYAWYIHTSSKLPPYHTLVIRPSHFPSCARRLQNRMPEYGLLEGSRLRPCDR